MKSAIIFTLSILPMISAVSFATIINIPDDYPTIQLGIDASTDGDTVLVQPGTYVENINFNGHNIVLGSLFLTTGDTTYISETVIDGDSLGSVVTFCNGEDSTAILAGLTILNGYSPGTECGGICCYNNSDPTIVSNLITGNSAYLTGGGIYTEDSSPTISENIIINNSAFGEYDIEASGGGIACAGNSRPVISGNTITQNSAVWNGGGVHCTDDSQPIIDNNIISENSAFKGGAICGDHDSCPLIAHNTVTRNSASIGAGICCGGSNAIIEFNTITLNAGEYGGAGIFFFARSGMINGNHISENSAYNVGGGISCLNSSPEMIGNIISNNHIGLYGGGIYCQYSNPVIHGNTITGNTAISGSEYWGYGGAVSCHDNSNADIRNNIVAHNSASEDGGAIFCRDSSPLILNNTFTRNSAAVSGGGIYCESVSNPLIINTIFWADSSFYGDEIDIDDSSSPLFTYCDIQGGWGGEGNIDVDPLFRDPENGDFHLMSTSCGDPFDSPCIDTGSPAILDSLLDCSWGLGTILSDMGAYGGGDSATVDIEDYLGRIPSRFTLLQNYPNPFNPSTTVSYSLPEKANVRIEIYNILGQHVATLFDGPKQPGYHTLTWQADNHPSGVYFARLETNNGSKNIKMMLIK